MLISEAQLLEVLRRQNSWWQTDLVPPDLAQPFRRLAFYEIDSLRRQKQLRRAVILTGARRVGKTVLLHQLADEARRRGLPAKKIVYISFEDPTLNQANLREILSLYERNVASIEEGTLILLDEVHYTADWARWLMTLLREYPKADIVATGSAAVLLKKADSESAAGRWVSVHVPTLSFFEYVQLRNLPIPRLPKAQTLAGLARLDAKQREQLISACSHLQIEFNQYLLQGGFPAAVSLPLPIAQRLLREDVVDKVLKRDMAHLYGARSLGELDQIFVYLCFNSGGIVEKNTLAKELGVAAATVENHLQRLEDAHLIYRLPPFRLDGKKSLKPRPKIHIADPTVRNAVLLKGESLFENDKELGAVVESCIFKHLYAYYYVDVPRFGYWRGTGDREVDFVATFPDGRSFGFEVKYREDPALDRKDGLLEFIAEGKNAERAYVITKKTEHFGPVAEGVFQIPAFLFTYLMGHYELNRWAPPS